MTSEKKTSKNQEHIEYPPPVVIPRAEHTISRKDLDREALKVMYRLRDAGYVAYLVGGGVRDILLGKKPKDFDISTNARPGEVRKIFRNSRIIGRRFRLVQVFFSGNRIVEVSTFRQRSEFDIGSEDKVLAANNTFGGPAEDAFRRDLTINAIFYEIENRSIIDYTGGVDDLYKGIVRVVGDPDRRITRDPVRIMRVIRHAARTGFEIEPATWEAVNLHMDKLELCPISRIRDELLKDLKGGASSAWVKLAISSGLFSYVFPFFKDLFDDNSEAKSKISDHLANVLAVIDRLHGNGQYVPDQLIFAHILIPWAEETIDFKEITTLKAAYDLSRNIRKLVEPSLSRINIKRGLQDSIARCFATLPILVNHDKDNNGKGWPKWLRKKSYFNDGLQMYKIYQESRGDGRVAELPGVVEPQQKKKDDTRKKPYYNSRGPAFAKDVKGGVFGFRRW